MKKAVIVLGIVFVGAASFFLGMQWTKYSISKSAERMQATLNFAHWRNYKRIKDDVSSGCVHRATAQLEQLVQQQEMLMAEYVQEEESGKVERYISQRDKQLPQRLQDYKVDWGKEWEIPPCEKKQ